MSNVQLKTVWLKKYNILSMIFVRSSFSYQCYHIVLLVLLLSDVGDAGFCGSVTHYASGSQTMVRVWPKKPLMCKISKFDILVSKYSGKHNL